MSQAKGIRAGRVFVEIGADQSLLTRALRTASNKMKTFSANVTSMGMKMTGLATAAGLPMLAAIRSGARFEQSMANVRAKLGASRDSMKVLNDEAKRLGKSTIFSASQAADAMAKFAISGFSADEILKAISPTLSLAAAGEIEIADAADIVSKAMRSMGIEAEKVGMAVDVITAATTKSNTNLEQFKDAMSLAAPIAANMNIPLQETAAAIGVLSDNGLQGEKAGTALRSILLKLSGPSAEAAATLEELNVQTKDAAGNLLPLDRIMENLNDSMAGLGTADRAAKLRTIFDLRQAAGASILAKNVDALRVKTQELYDSQGWAAKVAKIQVGTLSGAWTLFKSVIEAVSIEMTESLSPVMRVALGYVSEMGAKIADWIKNNKGLVAISAGVVAAVGGIGAALIGVGGLAAVASITMGSLVTVLTGVGAVIGSASAPLIALTGAVAGFGIYMAKTSGLIGAALDWLKGRFRSLSKYSTMVIDSMREKIEGGEIKAAADVLFAGLSFAWETGISKLAEGWNLLMYGVSDTLLQVGGWMNSTWIKICSGLSEAWTAMSMTMRTTFGDTTNWVSKQLLEVQGRIDGLDADQIAEGQRMLDRDNEERKSQIERETGQKMNKIENERKAKLDEARENLDKMRDMLDDDFTNRHQEAEQKLRDAEEALRKAIANAKSTTVSEDKETKEKAKNFADSIASMIKRHSKGGAVGSFNASAAWGMAGAGSHAKRTADATEKTAKNTARINRSVQQLTFT